MPPEIKDKPGTAMATDVATAGGADEPRDDRPSQRPAAPGGPGFFTIYKRGQGYWTRMGTAVAAGLLGALTAYNLYIWVPALINLGSTPDAAARGRQVAIGIAAGLLAVYGLFIWRLINKPTTVDFLIATDSEMKKVNWTSRKELIGSTKVVIVFMFLIATFLFPVDVLFGYLFYMIGVLKNSPFGGGGTIGGG